ncbi:hypothetical protein E4T42_04197 [Aureobasidium subglaciale]|nr:hypothetical protein E4T42_04197 [Aureobasidium subglaciale]
MVRFAMGREMMRHRRHVAIPPPTPPNEEYCMDQSVGQSLLSEILPQHIKQENVVTDLPRENWKEVIEMAIDAQENHLTKFLDEFSAAMEPPLQPQPGKQGWNDYATTAPVAAVIGTFLSARQLQCISLGSPQFPSMVSIFDEGEGPCLVLNGLLTPRTLLLSRSFNEGLGQHPCMTPLPADAAGTAAIVAAYAYLHSIREHLVGTIVLEAISDTEEGHLGTCHHLLHTDERSALWKGDCMITAASRSTSHSPISSPDTSIFRTGTRTIDSATFDVNTLRWTDKPPTNAFTASRLSTTKRILGRRPSIPDFQTGHAHGSHARFWAEVGVPSFCLGVGGVDNPAFALSREQTSEGDDADRNHMVDSGIEDVEMKDEHPAETTRIQTRVSEADQKQWIQLVKVLVLTAWDQVGLEST